VQRTIQSLFLFGHFLSCPKPEFSKNNGSAFANRKSPFSRSSQIVADLPFYPLYFQRFTTGLLLSQLPRSVSPFVSREKDLSRPLSRRNLFFSETSFRRFRRFLLFTQRNTQRRAFTRTDRSHIKKDRNKRLPGTSKQPEDSRSPWDLRAPSSRGSAVFIKDVEFGDRPRSIEDRQHSKSSSRSPWSDRSLEAFASASAARDGDISRVTHSVNRLFAESSAFPAAASI
jgi:hypothetical protein